jgi:hypothetical protein
VDLWVSGLRHSRIRYSKPGVSTIGIGSADAGATAPSTILTSPGTVYRVVHTALTRELQDDVETHRRLEGDRLDALQVSLWDRAMAGDTAAAHQVIHINHRGQDSASRAVGEDASCTCRQPADSWSRPLITTAKTHVIAVMRVASSWQPVILLLCERTRRVGRFGICRAWEMAAPPTVRGVSPCLTSLFSCILICSSAASPT